MLPKAWILSIGNEVVTGQIINTNGAWLAKRLTVLGFDVRRIIAVPDLEEEVVKVIKESINENIDVVVSTGGLGPTYDDRTSEFLAKALRRKLVINSDALKMIEEKYKSKGLSMTEHRVKMAMLPEGAKPIPNPVGTAPAILVEVGKTIIIALPGVPREMKAIYEEYVEDILKKRAPKVYRSEKWFKVVGIPESTIAPIIDRVVKKYRTVYVKSHPRGEELNNPIIHVYVVASSLNDQREAAEIAEKVYKELVEEFLKLKGKIEELEINSVKGGE